MLKSVAKLKAYLLTLGVPGVFLIALLDSAGIPLPGGPDAVLILVAWHSPASAPWAVLAAVVGSTVGCVILYSIGRGGGELALARFREIRRARVKRWIDQYDALAMVVAVTAPPPFPTKLVVLSAGVFRMRWARFIAGVFVGRCLRFGLEGFLGARFGDQAAALLKQHSLSVLLALMVLVGLYLLTKHFVKRPVKSDA